MLEISEKEYQNLLQIKAETRRSIGIYIGYIVSIAGLSGYILKLVLSKEGGDVEEVLLLTISLIVITLLFEIVWYKFKSHNRYNAYMQLLMQEDNYILIKSMEPLELENKTYVKDYKRLMNLENKETLDKENLYTWEYIIARLNNTVFHNLNKAEAEIRNDILNSTNHSKFVFSIPDRYDYSCLKDSENLDSEFFDKIIYELYKKEKWYKHILSYLRAFLYSPYELFTKFKILKVNTKIDRRYIVSGWRYPRKVTQIGFLSTCFLFTFFIYKFSSNYEKVTYTGIDNDSFLESIKCIYGISSLENIFVFILLLIVVFIFFYWWKKYVNGLKRMIYKRNSIEYYCWTFFIFRIQKLNSIGIIPIYFSRSFIRFYKNKLIIQYLKDKKEFGKLKRNFKKSKLNNKFLECIICERRRRRKRYRPITLFIQLMVLLKIRPNNKNHLNPCKNYLEVYSDEITNFQRIEDDLRELHKYVVERAKKYGNIIREKST